MVTRPADVYDPRCATRVIANHVTSRWGALVLGALAGRRLRFAQLRRAVGGVSDKMLAQTLHALNGDGLVLRHDHREVPPRVEYTLTPLGERLAEHVVALFTTIQQNRDAFPQQQTHPDLSQ